MALRLKARQSQYLAFSCQGALFINHSQQFIRRVVSMVLTKDREKWTVWDYGLSWGIIGAFSTLNSPIDIVRFRMQVMPILVEQGHLQSLYKGCWNCASRMYKYEGFRTFFKGNMSNLLRVVPSETLVWSLKQTLQRYFHYHHDLSDTTHLFYNTIIGITAGLSVSLTLYPLEFIRQQLLNRTDREGRSLWYYLKKTISNEGVSGMYKGGTVFSVGLVLFRGTYFGVYDSLKVKTRDKWERWMASFLASYLAIMIGYPIDTIRRRFVSSRDKYTNTRECLRDILKKQGFKALYLGWPMIFIQSFSASTIFYFYDRLVTDYEQAID